MKFRQYFFKNKKEREKNIIYSNDASQALKEIYLSTEEIISYIQQTFSNTDDMVIKEIKTDKGQGVIVYLETMVDKEKIQKYVLKPIYLLQLTCQYYKYIPSQSILFHKIPNLPPSVNQ